MVSDLVTDAAEKHSSDMAKYGLNPVDPHITWQSDFFPEGVERRPAHGPPRLHERHGLGRDPRRGPTAGDDGRGGLEGSPDHDRQMTEPSYKVMGVGLVYVAGSQYGYYWTIDFGVFVDEHRTLGNGASPLCNHHHGSTFHHHYHDRAAVHDHHHGSTFHHHYHRHARWCSPMSSRAIPFMRPSPLSPRSAWSQGATASSIPTRS